MILPEASGHDRSLMVIECALTLIAIAVAFAWPRLGITWFTRIERAFGRLARRRWLAVALVGLSVLLLRLAILPLYPIPLPFVTDDFSFLLAADTFAHGRLTNPTPAMWTHFESIHVTMQPTYMSMYFPAQGLVLAAGTILFGHPWFGLLCVDALMCGALCWMLQAWMPPPWALLGGILAILRLGLFSLWINTYHTGGSIAALGGMLVLGALPRFMKTARLRHGMVIAAGVVLLLLTRPYEGLLLCLPVAVALCHWMLFGKNRPNAAALIRCAAAPLALMITGGAWLGYYDYRAFGSPLTLPYTINRNTYAIAPYYIWQSQRPAPVYRHEEMQRFYSQAELDSFKKIHNPAGFLPYSLVKVEFALLFYCSFALLPPLIMLRRVFMDRRIRFLVLCMPVMIAGLSIEIFLLPHYVAPFTAVFYAIGLQAMRHLRLWMPEGKPVGIALVRLVVTLCIVLACLRVCAASLKLSVPEWPASNWSCIWYGPELYGTERAQIESRLEQLPGGQLAIVRYAPGHEPLDEWVYNAADVDHSKVIWAREMNAANNLELMNYYRDRKVWLVQPDAMPPAATPYPMPELSAASSH